MKLDVSDYAKVSRFISNLFKIEESQRTVPMNAYMHCASQMVNETKVLKLYVRKKKYIYIYIYVCVCVCIYIYIYI